MGKCVPRRAWIASMLVVCIAGCARHGDERFIYLRGAIPRPLVRAREAGTYGLYAQDSMKPKFTIDLAAGDMYGFRKREDDAIVAVAKDKEIELGDRYVPSYYWLPMKKKEPANEPSRRKRPPSRPAHPPTEPNLSNMNDVVNFSRYVPQRFTAWALALGLSACLGGCSNLLTKGNVIIEHAHGSAEEPQLAPSDGQYCLYSKFGDGTALHAVPVKAGDPLGFRTARTGEIDVLAGEHEWTMSDGDYIWKRD